MKEKGNSSLRLSLAYKDERRHIVGINCKGLAPFHAWPDPPHPVGLPGVVRKQGSSSLKRPVALACVFTVWRPRCALVLHAENGVEMGLPLTSEIQPVGNNRGWRGYVSLTQLTSHLCDLSVISCGGSFTLCCQAANIEGKKLATDYRNSPTLAPAEPPSPV